MKLLLILSLLGLSACADNPFRQTTKPPSGTNYCQFFDCPKGK